MASLELKFFKCIGDVRRVLCLASTETDILGFLCNTSVRSGESIGTKLLFIIYKKTVFKFFLFFV